MNHFVSLNDIDTATLSRILTDAARMKAARKADKTHTEKPLSGHILGFILEKPSTRTRVSFEAGMVELGGHAIVLSGKDSQLSRGEPIADTARVLSGMVDAIAIRTFSHERIAALAANANVPVINALSDAEHPCQLLADLLTLNEHFGQIAGLDIAWVGDGNNVCISYLHAARLMGFTLHIACPEAYLPPAAELALAGDAVKVHATPKDACRGAQVITTDVFTSMGQEAENAKRLADFAAYCVNDDLMKVADSNAIFLHCLPAHRGEEVAASVVDGAQSRVWQQAENRLHSQKALLKWCVHGLDALADL